MGGEIIERNECVNKIESLEGILVNRNYVKVGRGERSCAGPLAVHSSKKG